MKYQTWLRFLFSAFCFSKFRFPQGTGIPGSVRCSTEFSISAGAKAAPVLSWDTKAFNISGF